MVMVRGWGKVGEWGDGQGMVGGSAKREKKGVLNAYKRANSLPCPKIDLKVLK